MALERTLHLFRDVDVLRREHPLYRMLSAPNDALKSRADGLAAAVKAVAPAVEASVREDVGYLGSGSLPTEALPTWVVALTSPDLTAAELARRLRTDEACVFTRTADDIVILDARTISDQQVAQIVAAVARVIAEPKPGLET
jgi:L-seryl-tRNA(Ser) seleniumtransferase